MTIKLTNNDKIILDIPDDLLFEMIARIVDNEEFVREVMELRKALKIDPIPYEDMNEWFDTRQDREKVGINLRLSRLKENFKLGDNLDKALRTVLVANCITDVEIGTTFCAIYPSDESESLEFDTPTVAIFLTEQTKKEEVLELMDTQVKDLFENINGNRKLTNKSSWSMRRARDWYWRKKDMTYDKLLDELFAELGEEAPASDTMRKAIQRYRKKIEVGGH